MSGHSKWATIKHQKGAKDAKRGKLFAKLARQIEVTARAGGPDPASNAALRTAVLKAKAGQMTNEAIDRAIKRGAGTDEGGSYEAITYEGYAPGGVALMVDALTDNRNRTGSNIRTIFSKLGGSMAEPGAVGWQFSRKGVVIVDGAADPLRLGAGAFLFAPRHRRHGYRNVGTDTARLLVFAMPGAGLDRMFAAFDEVGRRSGHVPAIETIAAIAEQYGVAIHPSVG